MMAPLWEWRPRQPLLILLLWGAVVPWLLFPSVAPLITAVSLILLLALLFANPSVSRFSLPTSPINGYLLIFLLLTGIAYIVSPLPDISLPKLTVTFLGAATFFLFLPRIKTPEAIQQLMVTLALCTGLVVLAGFFALEWPARQIIDLQPITDRLPHLTGSFTINYNEMAGTLLLLLPFVGAAFRQANGRFRKLLFLSILLALGIMLFFTQSRSGLVGLAVIGLTWLVWGRIPLQKLLVVLIIIALVLILLFLVMDYSLADFSNWLSILDANSKQGDVAPTSWLTRLDIWRVGGRMLKDYAVIGGGLYTFDPVSRANYTYETILPSFNLTHAHNLLLQTGTSLGLSGIVALAGIWATVLSQLWRIGRSGDAQMRELSAVFAASVLGYLFFNLFDTITFGQKPALFIWIILAGSLGLSQLTAEKPSVNRPIQRRLLVFSPLIVLFVLLLSPALPHNLANLRLDQARFQPQSNPGLALSDYAGDARRQGLVYYISGQTEQALEVWQTSPDAADFLQAQGTIALVTDQPARAISWYNLSLTLNPDSAETYFWRGAANEMRGTLSMAEADFRSASQLVIVSETNDARTAVIHYRLGLLLVKKADWQGAAAAFRLAATLQPQISTYHQILGDVLTTLGDRAGAEAAYKKAAEQ